MDIVDDRLDVVTRGLMGMTLACARCHDHKFDPLTQADYHAMLGVFYNTDEPGGEPWPHRLVDSSEKRQAFILIRGSPGRRGDAVPRRFVSLLAPSETPFGEGSGRVELAQSIVSTDNPLTARVIANRLWLQLTGSSLIESPSDLGMRSPQPHSHRRTVYAYIDRQNLPQVFRTFDLASPENHTPVRAQTSVPQQGLYLLNSDFVAELSQQLAHRQTCDPCLCQRRPEPPGYVRS